MPRVSKDMKVIIAEAAKKRVKEKNVKRLTVKDIVGDCGITRQTFYYHFRDIRALLQWIVERESEKFLEAAQDKESPEEKLKCFFLAAIEMLPYVRKSFETNYGPEIEELLERSLYWMLEKSAREAGMYADCSYWERELQLRYHTKAVMGLLRSWTDEDTENLDGIVHQVYLLMTGTGV